MSLSYYRPSEELANVIHLDDIHRQWNNPLQHSWEDIQKMLLSAAARKDKACIAQIWEFLRKANDLPDVPDKWSAVNGVISGFIWEDIVFFMAQYGGLIGARAIPTWEARYNAVDRVLLAKFKTRLQFVPSFHTLDLLEKHLGL